MTYIFNAAEYRRVFAVPFVLIEKHIRLAGAAQLKVLLWLLSHTDEPQLIENIASGLGLAASDIADAMQYWIINGIVFEKADDVENKDGYAIKTHEKPAALTQNNDELQNNTSQRAGNKRVRSEIKPLTRSEAALEGKNNPEIAWMLGEAQSRFGRPLSASEMTLLVSLHVNEGLPVPIILMIIEYAAANEKCNIRYIDKLALNWSENDIDTIEKAEAFLKKQERLIGYWHKVQNAFSMEYRRPSEKEQIYAERWIKDWNMSSKMLKAAYDICVDNIGKLYLPYINKILEKWSKDGIATPEAAVAYMKKEKGKKQIRKKGSFETDELDSLFLRPAETDRDD